MDAEKICSKINNIIELVKIRELESGMSSKEISDVYVNGRCILLANLIKSQFLDNPDVRCVEFIRMRGNQHLGYERWNDVLGAGVIWQHVCAVVGGVDARGNLSEGAIVFDINGQRSIGDMSEYLESLYGKSASKVAKDTIRYSPYDEEVLHNSRFASAMLEELEEMNKN